MAGDNNFRWYFGFGSEPESYFLGGDTREATIAQARQEADGDGFTIVEADKMVPDFDCFDGDSVIERYEERNEECWGEDGAEIEYTPGQCSDLERVLSEALRSWFERYEIKQRVWNFHTIRVEEYFPPHEPIPSTPKEP